MFVTIRIRNLVAFAAGLAVAVVAAFVFQAWRVDAVGSDESTFVPIAPCRLFDYRPAPDTVGPRTSPLGPGEIYPQQVTGKVGHCNLPPGISAVSMNVTAVGGTAPSFLVLYPANLSTPPKASNLNWLPGQAPAPNKVDVKVSPSGAIHLRNAFGSVSVLADVTGYYTHSGLVDLQNQINAINAGTSVIPSGRTVTGYDIIERIVVPGTGVNSDTYGVKFPAKAPIPLVSQKVNFEMAATPALDRDPNCTGTVGAPTAPAGKVCIYIDFSKNMVNLVGNFQARMPDQGFTITWDTTGAAALGEDQYLWFTWAYRAP